MSHHVFIADPGTKSCMQEMGVMGALDARLPPQLACDFAIKEQGHKAMGSYDILAYLVHGTVSTRIKVMKLRIYSPSWQRQTSLLEFLSLKIFLRWLKYSVRPDILTTNMTVEEAKTNEAAFARKEQEGKTVNRHATWTSVETCQKISFGDIGYAAE